MEEVRLVFELALVHYFPTNVYDTESYGSRFDCADACFYNKTCVTMIYAMDTQVCYFYKKRATLAESGVYPLDSAIVMFNTKRDPCLASDDYTWNAALAVCYKFHSTGSDYYTALDTCTEEANGLLRVDTTQKEEFFLSVHGSSPFWVDGSLVDDQWVYSNGDAMVSEIWHPDEPNGDGPCPELKDVGLNDNSCGSLRAFFCEIHM